MTIPLSDAIELGAARIGDNRDHFLERQTHKGEPVWTGCAIGCAYAGVRERLRQLDDGEGWLKRTYPWTRQQLGPRTLPTRHSQNEWWLRARSVAYTISALHSYGMPRLQIAAWVREIEPRTRQDGVETEHAGVSAAPE